MSNKRDLAHQILRLRNVDETDWPRYLEPDFDKDTFDPFEMSGMEEAVERLIRSISIKETVVIFGDYDADGVPAVALMVRSLRRLGFEAVPIIPFRNEGYGLTASSIERILKQKPGLVITVDNGTTAVDEVGILRSAGVDVIVCDHHEPQEEKMATDIVALLNPKQPACRYPFSELCASAIAWKFMRGLFIRLGEDPEPLKWELDLAGLSTIADMVPLVGENHTIAVYGLKVLQRSRNVGIRALAEVAEVTLESLTARDVGFRIAPHINAPSRMHSEEFEGEHAALTLLTTDDIDKARKLARHMHIQNVERQATLNQHIKEAEGMVETCVDDLCVVLYQPGWSTGLIGLVAGRMLEKAKRPIIVLASESGVLKGSVRSVDGVHVLDMLSKVSNYLDHYGGHAKAGGLTLNSEEDSIPKISEAINRWMKQEGWTLERLAEATQREADITLTVDAITLEAVDGLARLEPFGIGFPSPLFSTTCLIRDVIRMGSERQHLRCFLEDDTGSRKAVGFGLGSLTVHEDKKYNVLYTVKNETWRDVRSPVCFIESIHPL